MQCKLMIESTATAPRRRVIIISRSIEEWLLICVYVAIWTTTPIDRTARASIQDQIEGGREDREWIHLARDRSTRGSEALGASTVPLSVTLATWVPTPAGRDEQQQQRHSKGVQLETTAGSVAERGSRAWR